MSRKRKPQSRRPGSAPAPGPRFPLLPQPGVPRPPLPRMSPTVTEGGMVWCRAEPDPFTGTFRLVITYDDDHALSLDRDGLFRYVEAISGCLSRACYTEALRRQFAALKMVEEIALPTIRDVVDEWPEIEPFGDYTISPYVGFSGYTGVQVKAEGGDLVVCEFAPHNVREHVAHALEVYAAADLDSAYRRYMVGVVGVDDATARAAVAALNEHIRED